MPSRSRRPKHSSAPLEPIQLSEDITGDFPQPNLVPAVGSELKREVKHGVCQWWSEEEPFFIHPEDEEIARQFVPGNRILRRQECDSYADRKLGYSTFSYGEITFRALPLIWLEIPTDGFEIDDLIQVKSQYGRRDPLVGKICEIQWNRLKRRTEYHISVNGQVSSQVYVADELQPAAQLDGHFNERQMKMAARSRLA